MNQINYTLQAGFSRLETLFAFVILSIGLLGIAGLQVKGQQYNHASYQRTQATFLAYELMDRMRINSDQVPNVGNGNGNADDGAYEYAEGIDFFNTIVGTSPVCDGDLPLNCSPTNLTHYDLAHWINAVRNTLPWGEARIDWDFDNTVTPILRSYTIIIRWANTMDSRDQCEEDGEDKKKVCQQWRIGI